MDPFFLCARWEASNYEAWCENLKKKMSNTQDILQKHFGQDYFPQEVSFIDLICSDIWFFINYIYRYILW